MNAILEKLGRIGIIPVIKITDTSKAAELAGALSKGGIPCAEVTFRAAGADKAIRAMIDAEPDMLVGAGTVLTCEQADAAISAGAKFIVSPGLNPEVVRHCISKNVPITPGCATPSDIEAAIGLGLDVVKFFPAEALGGLPMIKALAAPYGQVKFIPTGGINAKNLNEYLSFPKVIACGGSWMVNEELIEAGKFGEVTTLAGAAVHAMLGFGLAHVGINTPAEGEADTVATAFCDLFGLQKKPGNSAIFSGEAVEVMKSLGRGTKGHIGFLTNSIPRAMAYLERKGVAFIPESAGKGPDGSLRVIYLRDEIAGFAIHLLQR